MGIFLPDRYGVGARRPQYLGEVNLIVDAVPLHLEICSGVSFSLRAILAGSRSDRSSNHSPTILIASAFKAALR
jgi:hypothetical protein